jgi:hypothetical protein
MDTECWRALRLQHLWNVGHSGDATRLELLDDRLAVLLVRLSVSLVDKGWLDAIGSGGVERKRYEIIGALSGR